ncbi:hypothetical protein HG531_009389 [Fusarium graminearum]|nr:hypothetical protein HG531_009389 [Fusarium graminearum]
MLGSDFNTEAMRLGDQHSSCQTVAGITRDDVDVFVALVLANKLHKVHWLKYLPTPTIINRANLRETLASPRLQLLELSSGVFLANLVITASNDDIIVLVVAGCQANVFVLVSLVIKETVLDRTLRYSSCDTRNTSGFDGVVAPDRIAI